MSDDIPVCRLCGSSYVQDMGVIPDSDYFAGNVLGQRIRGGRLWSCVSCRSMFRHPVLSPSEYLTLYESGKSTQWTSGDHRRDLQIVRSIIAAESRIDTILDIGCGTGDFLVSLPKSLVKFGIEPSAAASVDAALRGIEIVSQTIEHLSVEAKFDAITIIDVIEHTSDPGSLLSDAYAHTLPGGLIIVSTGDPENPIWRRLLMSRFWYASFPEHLSFPSVGFFRMWSARNNALTEAKIATRYQRLPQWQAILSLLIQAAYCASPLTFSWVGRLGERFRRLPGARRQCFSPGVPGLFVDHHVITIRKPQQ